MRLRWTLTLAFVALAVAQVAVVVPLALDRLSRLLTRQLEARIAQQLQAVDGELARLDEDVRRRLEELAASPALEDVARDAAQRPPPGHVTTAARLLMAPRGLEVLALLDEQGRTLSSGHLPARLGEPDDPLFPVTARPRAVQPVMVEVSTPEGSAPAPALVMAIPVEYGERRVWVVGGTRLGERQARTLAAITGARVSVLSLGRPLATAGEPAVAPVIRERAVGDVATVQLRFSRADDLATRGQVLGGFAALAAVGLILSVVLGFVVSARISRPVDALTVAARQIAQGSPGVEVDPRRAWGELKLLAETFNRMTVDLKAATDRLVASERVAAWQEVARRLAHEIKNPLTPIRMSLETLLAASQRGMDGSFKALFAESATAMVEEVDRLKRIVDEFSAFARLPRPEPRPVELSELVEQVMALYADHGPIRYAVATEPGLTVLADRDQLTQLLVNLVKNAEEAMPGGGTVTVRTLATPGHAVVEVTDEGPGIPPSIRERLFEPYVTTKAEGTGLGLAIAHRIAVEHHGTLTAGPGPGDRGAVLRLTLPR